MKLIRAEFTNFRILRNLILDFSTDTARRLTVIRAENASGKTTILDGLQWALYGDKALRGGRQGYRLHPIDWVLVDGERVPITVEIDFEVAVSRRSRSYKQTYRIIRSTYDVLRGKEWEPGPSTVELYETTTDGSVPVEPPDAKIRDLLPIELREIFFTDGDRALSFIEADVAASTKQARVREAIQALLGLDVIQGARNRVKRVASSVNKQAKTISSDCELSQTVDRINQLDLDTAELEKKIEIEEQRFANFDERYADINKRIEETLIKGNREDLQRELSQIEQKKQQIGRYILDIKKKHSDLFRSMELSRDIAVHAVEFSLGELDDLRDQGKIPNSTIPVLEERLKLSTCICGESIQGHGQRATKRRGHIQHLIEQSLKADTLQIAATELYFGSQWLQPGQVAKRQTWDERYEEVARDRERLEKDREEHGRHGKALEAKIDEIPEDDIQGLRETRREYMQQRDRAARLKERHRVDLGNVRKEQHELNRKRAVLLRQQKRGARIMADLDVALDIETILNKAYTRLTTEELEKVSSQMNSFFMDMIGVDPEQGANIQRAEINSEFDILVYGPKDRTLDPDSGLSGAQRRALTLAFILALTKVSEVEAPNVIDTPLGMMSGYIRRSVLKTAIRESSQLILFLTRSEIVGCEEILDAESAHVVTITNSDHYPVVLVNDPMVEERTILRCQCNHNEECNICRRRTDVGPDIVLAV